jgi:iron(III) transport system permease protein
VVLPSDPQPPHAYVTSHCLEIGAQFFAQLAGVAGDGQIFSGTANICTYVQDVTLMSSICPREAAAKHEGSMDPLLNQPLQRRTSGPMIYRLKAAFQDSSLVLALLLLVLFVYLIAAPLLSIFGNLVIAQIGDFSRTHVQHGMFTGYYLERVFASKISPILFYRPLINTLVLASGATVFALSLGTLLGWLLARTDLPGRRWFSTALIVPYMLPASTYALAWLTLFKNRTVGGQPGWFEVMGFAPPNWMSYGIFPTMVILSLHYTPFAILLVGNALRRIDGQMEEAARMLGAPRARIVWQIVLPLVRPALFSACLLIFADGVGEFSVAYILGLPVKFETLSTSLYRAIGSQQDGVAAVIAGVIMVIGVLTLSLDAWLLREARRFATIGGKGMVERMQPLGRWRWPAFALACATFFAGVVAPLGALALSTVMKLPGRFRAENFTFDYWIGTDLHTVALRSGILIAPEFWNAFGNSVRIVGTASITAGVLGILVGYAVVRSPVRAISVTLRQITFLPYLVPGIAFAAAFLSLFAVARGPVPALYGTPMILFLALVADQMPFASRTGIAAMTQLGREAEEAGRVAGAGWLRRMRSIVLPIQRGPLITAVLMPFISGIKNVSLFIILAVPATDVLTTWALRLVDYNYEQAANAVVLMIALVSWLGTVAINRLTKTGIAQGLGS